MGTESLDDGSRRERYAPYVEAWRRRLAAQREAAAQRQLELCTDDNYFCAV
jgi:hypothetical protein